ncbi:MAG: winged helix-turn-helix domain-containing protein [Terracidiphilus sp.]
MMANKSFVFRFADIEVRQREFSIVKAGEVLPIEPKAFRVLLILLRNPQKLISKEELLNAVWGDAAVTENSLTRSIALLRRLLGDDTHNPRYIETIATVGYRLICKVEVAEDASGVLKPAGETPGNAAAQEAAVVSAEQADHGVGRESASAYPKRDGRKRLAGRLLATAAVLAVGIAAAIWYLHRPLPQPRISAYTRITHDGHEKLLAGTDGSRLYFMQMQPKSLNQVGVAGGEVAQIPAEVPGIVFMLDASPDGSNLLVNSLASGSDEESLWIVRALGGSSRRIANDESATFSPDGSSIAYSTSNGELWMVQSDGTGGHKVASIGGYADDLHWSPDGNVIRFNRGGVLWEISANGSGLHEVLPGWQYRGQECCGRWTADGEFYIFLAAPTPSIGDQIWALDERRGLFRHPSAKPFQLTTGPIRWGNPIPGKGTNKIFSDGKTPRGELSRFDPKTKQLQPFLGAISAQDVSFSKDGRTVAYVTYPDGILWKANRDGSNPVQLTTGPNYAMNPRWSPDGTEILFTDVPANDPNKIYLVSSHGGSPQRLIPDDADAEEDASWSADGRKIVFRAEGSQTSEKDRLLIFDLASRKVSVLPGSAGLWSPRWSPDGKYIAAMSFEVQGLKLLDVATQRWSTLPANERMDYPVWSSDSKYVYFLRLVNGDRGVYRIRAIGGKIERVADLKDWHITGYYSFWMALDPTDGPLLLRDVGSDDIYALTLDEK